MTDEFEEASRASCPDCGKQAGPKGRIRHDEFCPRRTASAAVETDSGGDRPPSSRRRAAAPRFTRDGFAKDVENLTIMLQGVTFAAKPEWSMDALDQAETTALSNAIADEVFTHRRLRAWAEKAMAQSTHAVLAFVVIRIALPRIQRHQAMAILAAMPEEQRAAAMAAMAAQAAMFQSAAAQAEQEMMRDAPIIPPVYATQGDQPNGTSEHHAMTADAVEIPPVHAERS